ncbi:MAG: hypothetical protein M1402_01835 [Candidatus Thermoplasmatota archaeon]|nr:hypothetical protein [Candidatus Thermoplasmatota archaeon]MCL5665306.1 hypothetical protein [Candidatus Thermoplasmatota archaeon]
MADDVPDLASQVEQNRGIIKKIQLYIPGFRAYRTGDDLRVADALLRKQVSENLNIAMNNLRLARTTLAQQGDFQVLSIIGNCLSGLQQLDGEILHSAQGYTGISPAVRIDESKLKDLYQYDFNFIETSDEICKQSDPSFLGTGDVNSLVERIQSMQNLINSTRINWEKRLESVQKILIR